MKMVILDGYLTNPGDLDWSELERLGDLSVYDTTEYEQVVERLKGATVAFTNKVRLTGEHFKELPELKYIGVIATGFDTVDLKAAKENGIVVTNVPTYAASSVPQLTFALILELCFRISKHSKSVTEDMVWSNSRFSSYWLNPLVGLEGKTLGVVGMGRIGQRTANIGLAFGMKILAYDVFKRDLPNIKWAELDELLRSSDVVALHCPLIENTRGMINKNKLALMKQSAFLINTSRGSLVVDQDLADALNRGEVAGAGLDVLGSEPPQRDNPLLRAKNVVITPHIGWATLDARKNLIHIATENFKAFLQGRQKNVVNN